MPLRAVQCSTGFQGINCRVDIKADDLGDFQKLYDIHPSLPVFDVRNEWLMPAHGTRNLRLRQTGGLPLRQKHRHKARMPVGMKRVGHPESQFEKSPEPANSRLPLSKN